MNLIALCARTGTENNFIKCKAVAIGIEGDLDDAGKQIWYDEMSTLCAFHPEVAEQIAKL